VEREHICFEKWGISPALIEPAPGQSLLRNLEGARGVMTAALDGGGRRIGSPVASTKTPGGWRGAAWRLGYDLV
jgi:hypothetical protein